MMFAQPIKQIAGGTLFAAPSSTRRRHADEADLLHRAVPGSVPPNRRLPAGQATAFLAHVPDLWLASYPGAAPSGLPPTPLPVLLPETPVRAADARCKRHARSRTRSTIPIRRAPRSR